MVSDVLVGVIGRNTILKYYATSDIIKMMKRVEFIAISIITFKILFINICWREINY